jgi:hypothetical protein
MGLAALVLANAAAAEEARWQRYYNEKFGFGLSVPSGFLARDAAASSPEGATLKSADGKVVVNVFGSDNRSGKSLSALVSAYKRSTPDARVTYQWRGRRAAVLSGFQGGDVFYVRLAMSPRGDRVAVLNMTYARDIKGKLDPIVTRLSRSLFIR